MAGNSGRRGAVRKSGSKKGARTGSGGQRRRGLEGRGPTPKAEDRVHHPAHAKARAQQQKAAAAAGQTPAARTAKLRRRLGIGAEAELIVGRNSVSEAVTAGVSMTRVFMQGSAVSDERLGIVVRTATALGAPLLELSRSELDVLAGGDNHQGVAIEVPPHEYVAAADLMDQAASAGQPALIVALDHVTDPHNLGAVMRSAAAFGAHGVLIPERRSAQVNATVWKVSAGAAARIAVARETNLVRALEDLKSAGCFVVGLDAGGDETVTDLSVATAPLVVVTGSEGKGLGRLVAQTCDLIASINIGSDVESLNASVATGIALHSIAEQRRAGG